MSKLQLYYPSKPYLINQRFGQNNIPFYKEMGLAGHNGMDLQAGMGQPIMSAHDGIVTFTGEDGSGGLGVVIRTDQEFDYENGKSYFKTIYWHIQKNSFKVKPGDIVKAGQVIALADNTGRSTGSHLHFGLKPIAQGEQEWQWFNLESTNGYNGAIDPEPYFTGTYADGLGNIITEIKYFFTRPLRKGSRGKEVIALQKRLDIPADGIFGIKTEEAVKKFQNIKGIRPDGIVGPVTRKFLNI